MAFLGAWASHQAALDQLRDQIVKRGDLLGSALNEAAKATQSDDEIRFAVEEIVGRESAVYGIAVATKAPLVIWASSFRPGTDEDELTQSMLLALQQTLKDGVFGHYFAPDGDLITLIPLSLRAAALATALQPAVDERVSAARRRAVLDSSDYPWESRFIVPAALYRGAIYLRFDWESVKQNSGSILWRSVIIILAGIALMGVLAYWLLYRAVLKPMAVIGTAMQSQKQGKEGVRVPTLEDDEIGRLGVMFNQMLDTLLERDRRFRIVVDHLPIAVSLKDMDGHELTNQKYEQWFCEQRTDENSIAKAETSTLEDLSSARAQQALQVIDSGEPVTWEEQWSASTGERRVFVTSLFPVFNAMGHLDAIGSASTDITEQKKAEEHIQALAYFDTLTKIPNRTLFYDRLQQALAHAQRNQQNVGLLYLDLDNFKAVNDTLGHSTGDRLLQMVTKRVVGCVRQGDTVARIGGDEFTVIVDSLRPPNTAKTLAIIAEKVLAALSKPVLLDEQEIFVTASIGIAHFPQDGNTVEELVKNADTAMYHSKSLGRDNCQFFLSELDVAAKEQQRIEVQLHHALKRGEMTLNYQPQVDLATGCACGVEVLLRWTNPILGTVQPRMFIPAAESTGFIVHCGEWVLQQACRRFRKWHSDGMPLIRLSVNLSPRQFRQSEFVSKVNRILSDSEVDPTHLELEVTESSIINDPKTAVAMLQDLKGLGVRVAIDDFGTGYSSLRYLRELPIDVVKIDRSFIQDITDDPTDVEIVMAIIAMAKGLKKEVIAEGVETDEQLALLRELGCDKVQGYVCSRPLPEEEFVRWMDISTPRKIERSES